MYYHARYYDPVPARWTSPDTLVPGKAPGAGSSGTIGLDDKAATRGLTVDFHEPVFAAGLGAEDRFTLQQGFGFQLSDDDKQRAKDRCGAGYPDCVRYDATIAGRYALI